jgi:hypothetical protein
VVGEGHSEAAFLRYLKSRYAPRGCGVAVTVSNAKGRGPAHVIAHTIGQMRSQNDYDLVAAMLDADLPCPPADLKKARDHRISLIWSSPCFEAMLLEILEDYVPLRTHHCKIRFDASYGIDRCDPDAYAELFPRDTLEIRRQDVSNFDSACRVMNLERAVDRFVPLARR